MKDFKLLSTILLISFACLWSLERVKTQAFSYDQLKKDKLIGKVSLGGSWVGSETGGSSQVKSTAGEIPITQEQNAELEEKTSFIVFDNGLSSTKDALVLDYQRDNSWISGQITLPRKTVLKTEDVNYLVLYAKFKDGSEVSKVDMMFNLKFEQDSASMFNIMQYKTGTVDGWSKIELPISEFEGLRKIRRSGFNMVSFSINNNSKGILYLDNIYFK